MATIGERMKKNAKKALWRVFEQGQRVGIDVLPRHFYSEIPDLRALRASDDWRAPYSMAGIAGAGIAGQVEFLDACCPASITAELARRRVWDEACAENAVAGYGPVEAEFLFAFVATRKPRQIFQIGCGVSTAVCLLAATYAQYSPSIVCVEPYPTDYLLREVQRGRVSLIREKAQSLQPSTIDALGPDTLFFVDSTHTLGPGGEVSRIVLELLPRLKAGACVHFHDIYFPYDYTRDVLDSLFFPHESVLLQAFLAFNSRFRITASLSMLHYEAPQPLARCLPVYRPGMNAGGLQAGDGHFPSSTYLEVTRDPEPAAGSAAA